jgi:hypothetical protein
MFQIINLIGSIYMADQEVSFQHEAKVEVSRQDLKQEEFVRENDTAKLNKAFADLYAMDIEDEEERQANEEESKKQD